MSDKIERPDPRFVADLAQFPAHAVGSPLPKSVHLFGLPSEKSGAPSTLRKQSPGIRGQENYAQSYPHLWITRISLVTADNLTLRRVALSTLWGFDRFGCVEFAGERKVLCTHIQV